MTPEQLAAIATRNEARTQGKWLGMNMVNIDGSSMTAENIGEYVKNSVKKTAEVQKVERFLFVTIDGDNQPDICHVGNGPMGPHNAAFIAHASEDIPSLLAEVKRLTAVIEHDRSKVVDVLAEANAVLKNYGWLAEGRGSYAFDDDRWKDEFKVCMDSLAKVLDPMRGIASDLSDSPIKWADIVAARSMTDAPAEAEQRGYDAAKEQAKEVMADFLGREWGKAQKGYMKMRMREILTAMVRP